MKYKRKNKAEAITQILILVIGIFAISWMIGGEIGVVSAADTCTTVGETRCDDDYTQETCIQDIPDNTWGNRRNCPNGCESGKCKTVPDKNKPTVQDVLQITNTGLEIKNLADEGKRMITPDLSEKTGEVLGSAAGKTAADTLYENAYKKAYDAALVKAPGDIDAANAAGKAAGDATISGDVKTPNKFDFDITQLLAHAGVAIAVGGLTKYITTEMGYSEKAVKTGMYLVGTTYFVTAIVAKGLGATFAAEGATGFGAWFGSFAASGLIGLGAAAAIFLIYFGLIAKKQAVQTVIYNCYNWDAEPKGLKCDLCNRQSFPCTEYQCQSLGQACELIKDTNDENYGLCFWKNQNDRKYPLIQVWEEAPFFDKTNYKYIENTVIAPPDKGVYIGYTGPDRVSRGDGNIKCIPPFEPVAFGIKLDEIAMCKISPESSNSYSKMPEIYFNNGDSKYNHSLLLSHKSSELMGIELRTNYENERTSLINEGASSEELQILDQAYQEQFELINDREYTYYVRCKDANDNPNTNQFIFNSVLVILMEVLQ